MKAEGGCPAHCPSGKPPPPQSPLFFFFSFTPLWSGLRTAVAAVPASGLRAAVTRRLGERAIGLGGWGRGGGSGGRTMTMLGSPDLPGVREGLASLEWGPRTPGAALLTSSHPLPVPPGPSS